MRHIWRPARFRALVDRYAGLKTRCLHRLPLLLASDGCESPRPADRTCARWTRSKPASRPCCADGRPETGRCSRTAGVLVTALLGCAGNHSLCDQQLHDLAVDHARHLTRWTVLPHAEKRWPPPVVDTDNLDVSKPALAAYR